MFILGRSINTYNFEITFSMDVCKVEWKGRLSADWTAGRLACRLVLQSDRLLVEWLGSEMVGYKVANWAVLMGVRMVAT